MNEALRIAVLDRQLPAQLAIRGIDLGGVEIAWAGDDFSQFVAEVPGRRCQVLVVSLELVPGDPREVCARLVEQTGAELLIALYAFARRELLRALTTAQTRPLKAPLTVEQLRVQLTSRIIRTLSRAPSAPSAGPRAPDQDAPAPRFSPAQLARLSELDSAIRCECPSHVAQLVGALVAFEAYAAECEDTNPADAAIHAMLRRQTAAARQHVELALTRLIEHERIAL